ncbi:N-6 DNA methylase [Nocardioides sp.]|uniref:N-6 DNA methylase n=1 Tax=Nocardioides sp. TaxID=35761 RepID=UPI002B279EA1|nr:N-6 DNA methylase [Nocardioides sp.]
MSDLPQLAESVLAAERRLGSPQLAWDAVLTTVAAAHDLRPEGESRPRDLADPALAAWSDPAAIEHLAPVHEALVEGRQASGTFYTPPALVGWILDRFPADPEARVLDPACGAGHFLVAHARRLVERGVSPEAAVTLVHGVDLDPVAVSITRLRLRALAPSVDPESLDVRVGDGLHAHAGAPYDAVIGNPPFLGRLRGRVPAGGPSRGPDSTDAPVPRAGAYTDTSALFLRHALGLVRPGGTVALVQPLSLLAARDAAPVREAVAAAGAVTAFWSSLEPVFAGTAVLTCVPVVTTATTQGLVPTWFGPAFLGAGEQPLPEHEWGPIAAAAAGIPVVSPRTAGTLGDLGRCTADFRDQYYGLVPFVGEHPATAGQARLVTAGLIDPAECRWGEIPSRFAKTQYAAPSVDLDALHAEGSLSTWARARLVPKVLVATQGRVIEAVVDEDGDWLPSVPVLTVAAEPEHLWHLLAVLLAPPVVAAAAARYLGTALAPGAIKLSARQLASIPLPADREAWDRGAASARAAQVGGAARRREHLVACAEAMCTAYDDHEALAWWSGRLRPV